MSKKRGFNTRLRITTAHLAKWLDVSPDRIRHLYSSGELLDGEDDQLENLKSILALLLRRGVIQIKL